MGDVTLFHIWPSLCSQKVRLALAEKGVGYTSRVVNIGPAMENYAPWYVRLNPRAVVPTLQHGARVVTDSATIVRYVDAHFDGPALSPASPEDRAAMDRLIARADALPFRTLSYAQPSAWRTRIAYAAVGLRVRRLKRLAAQHPDLAEAYQAKLADVARWRADVIDPAAAAAAWAGTRAALDDLEATLSDGRPYLLGSTYTLADVLWTVSLARLCFLDRAPWRQAGTHPNLAAYYARVRARPGFDAARVWERAYPAQIAAIVLPYVLPRAAAAALALGALGWALGRLL